MLTTKVYKGLKKTIIIILLFCILIVVVIKCLYMIFQPVVLNWEWFCSLGDIWQCLESFLFVTSQKERWCYWKLLGRDTRMLLKIQCNRTPLTAKNSLALNANSAKAEKTWSKPGVRKLQLKSQIQPITCVSTSWEWFLYF